MESFSLFPNSSDHASNRTPWGLRATLALSALIILANFAAGILAAVGFVALGQDPELAKDPSRLASNGTLLTLSIFLSSPMILGLTLFFANLRRGIPIKDYLGLQEIHWKEAAQWLALLLFFAGASDLITFLLNRPVVEPFMLNAYMTATSKNLLWAGIVMAAPVSEEIFFRGFLFYGILRTRLGPAGAIVLSSLIWAPLHLQYDLYGMVTVLVLGFLLGYARWRTNSVYIPIVMHALMNFIAAMEIMIRITYF